MKYKEASVQGNTWIRSNQVTIENPLNGYPVIRFNEEVVYEISDRTITTRAAGAEKVLTPENAFTEFEILDIETNQATGQVATYFQVRQLLQSLYFHVAKERDKGPAPYESWVWNDETQSWEAPVSKPEGENWIWNEPSQTWVQM